MSIKDIKSMQSEKGFTIVELLIVIVVIGILAAIVIVAFNGVQNQAKGTQYKTDASSIAKTAEAYNADENNTGYPTTAAAVHGVTTVKLPSNVRLATSAVSAAPDPVATPAEATQNPSISSGTRTYKWKSCTSSGTGTGIVIYYIDPSKSGVQNVVAGTCTP